MKKGEWRFCALHWKNDPVTPVCDNFEFGTEEDQKKLNLVLKKFEDYCSSQRNTSFKRFKFWNRSDQESVCQRAQEND